MAVPAPSALPGAATALQLRSAPGGVLILTLPAAQRFDALRLTLREQFANPPGRFSGVRLRLELGRRELDMLEIRRLVHFFKDELEAEIVGLQCASESLQRMAERELKLKVHLSGEPEPAAAAAEPAPAVVAAPPPPANTPPPDESPTVLVTPPDESPDPEGGQRVLTVTHTLRSGAVLRYAGDIHVFGDVNPGAHLVAGGNIVVFGALKGLAHAGNRDGGDTAVILAFDLRPTQLRIGKVIGLSPSGDPDRPGRAFHPEIAFISDGSIVIEPYRGRLPGALPKESP